VDAVAAQLVLIVVDLGFDSDDGIAADMGTDMGWFLARLLCKASRSFVRRGCACGGAQRESEGGGRLRLAQLGGKRSGDSERTRLGMGM
jgi:hypothetical protein